MRTAELCTAIHFLLRPSIVLQGLFCWKHLPANNFPMISTIFQMYIMEVIALLITIAILVPCGQANIVISELNTNTPFRGSIGKFIELKFTDFCLFKRYSSNNKGPSLQGYHLIFMDSRGSKIWINFDLSKLHFKRNSPFLTLGDHWNHNSRKFDYNIRSIQWDRHSLVIQQQGVSIKFVLCLTR